MDHSGLRDIYHNRTGVFIYYPYMLAVVDGSCNQLHKKYFLCTAIWVGIWFDGSLKIENIMMEQIEYLFIILICW